MFTIIFTLIAIIIAIVVVYVLFALVSTAKVRRAPEQARFASGKLPSPLPNGDFAGSAENQGSWAGKSFDAVNNSGINLFNNKGALARKLPFKTYIGKGLTDPELDVLKIDYNVPENPFYVRFVLDEIVEVSPGRYLGKVYLRVLPVVPFAVQYFELKVG